MSIRPIPIKLGVKVLVGLLTIFVFGCKNQNPSDQGSDIKEGLNRQNSRLVGTQWIATAKEKLGTAATDVDALEPIANKLVFDATSREVTREQLIAFAKVGDSVFRVLVQLTEMIEEEVQRPGPNKAIGLQDFAGREGEVVPGLNTVNAKVKGLDAHFRTNIKGELETLQRAAGFSDFNEKFAAVNNFKAQLSIFKTKSGEVIDDLQKWQVLVNDGGGQGGGRPQLRCDFDEHYVVDERCIVLGKVGDSCIDACNGRYSDETVTYLGRPPSASNEENCQKAATAANKRFLGGFLGWCGYTRLGCALDPSGPDGGHVYYVLGDTTTAEASAKPRTRSNPACDNRGMQRFCVCEKTEADP